MNIYIKKSLYTKNVCRSQFLRTFHNLRSNQFSGYTVTDRGMTDHNLSDKDFQLFFGF